MHTKHIDVMWSCFATRLSLHKRICIICTLAELPIEACILHNLQKKPDLISGNLTTTRRDLH